MFSFLMKQNSPYLQMKMTHVQLSLVQRNVHVQQAIQEFHARVSFNTLKIVRTELWICMKYFTIA